MKKLMASGLLTTLLSCTSAPNIYLRTHIEDCSAKVQVYLPSNKGRTIGNTQGMFHTTLPDNAGRYVHDIRWENPTEPYRERFTYDIALSGNEPLKTSIDIYFPDPKIIHEHESIIIPEKCR